MSASVAMECRTDPAPISAILTHRPVGRHHRLSGRPCYGPGTSFTDEYAAALRRHLDQPGETGLHAAYDLGRRALGDGMTLIKLVTVHHESRMGMLRDATRQLPDADAFLREALGAYEIAELGFWEAQRSAALEHERVEVLSRLNDAHLAVMAVPALSDRLTEVCDRAMALVDGRRARLELRGAGRGRSSVVDRGEAGDGDGVVRVAVPARTGMGALDVWPRRGGRFSDADRAMLGQFALLASGAIDDARAALNVSDRRRSRSNAACCPASCRSCPASPHRRATWRRGARVTSAATGTT